MVTPSPAGGHGSSGARWGKRLPMPQAETAWSEPERSAGLLSDFLTNLVVALVGGGLATMLIITVIAHQDRPDEKKRQTRRRVLGVLWAFLIARTVLTPVIDVLPGSVLTPASIVLFIAFAAYATFKRRQFRNDPTISAEEKERRKAEARRRGRWGMLAAVPFLVLAVVLAVLPHHHH